MNQIQQNIIVTIVLAQVIVGKFVKSLLA